MKYDFITVGGATRDISFFTDQGVLIDNRRDVLRQELLAFEYGAKIKVDKFYYSFGGGAANSAVCLANFGFRTACLAAIGTDEGGRLIVANLKNRNIDTRLLSVIKGTESGTSFILVAPTGERVIFGSRGANRSLTIDGPQLKALRAARNIHIASLSGDWENKLKKVFSVCASVGTGQSRPQISWNPGTTQCRAGLKKIAAFLKKTTIFALNKDEAIELVLSSAEHRRLGRAVLNDTDNLLKIIKSFGPKIVMITMGQSGVKVYDGQQIYYQPIKQESRRVDTTGVGDVFNSTFAAGLVLFDGDINRALRLSVRNAAAKVAHLGAQDGLLKTVGKKRPKN
ncbi:TPA: hypothetical protein DCZ15_02620 [Candidatus Falkowbacteria bacterium]|jgi:ribokinase|nr:MAG: Sugar kinase, ribokinase family [Candidatus Falkowbacteria bacterium GW2011_GWF2_43_32]HBA36749.1 hypothetical protein [Candidatus Falkowbacteria bacterium]